MTNSTATATSHGPGITGISVTPHLTNPPADPAGSAVLTPTGGHASATFTREETKAPPHGKIGLWSISGDTQYQIKTHKIKDLKKTHIMKKCNDVWEMTRKHIEEVEKKAGRTPEGAAQIAIETKPNPDATNHEKSNVKREIVVISYTDGFGAKHYISQRDIPAEILDKMDQIREMVRPNVNFDPQAPLQISTKEFHPPKDLDEFLKKDFKTLEAGLPDPAKANALRNVLATEAMIQGLKTHVRAVMDHKETELNDDKQTPTLPYPDRTEKEEDIRKLKKLLQQLDSIDRRATFRAICTWDNQATGPITDEVREKLSKAADEVTLGGERAFQEMEKERQSNHYFTDSRIGRALGLFKPMDPKESRAYNLDMGDLLLPDRSVARERRVNTQRSDTKSCIEQFVVQMMMQLNNTGERIPLDTHPILEDLSETTRRQVVASIEASPLPPHVTGQPTQFYPMEYARTVYKQIKNDPTVGNTTLDMQKRLAAARSNPNPHACYDSCIK